MLASLAKIWGVFTLAEKRKAAWMLVLVVLMAMAETLGVLSIMPFLSVLGRPAVIHEHPVLQAAFSRMGFHDERDLILALGLASIVTVVAASAFKTVTLHVLNRFVHLERHSISARLLSRYLHQPYDFFLSHNPSALGKNILSEVDHLMFGLMHPLSQVLAQGAVVVAMAVLITIYDPLIALLIVAVLLILYGAIYGLVRKRLARIGHEAQDANELRYQACNEALGGIKDIKTTHSIGAYLQQFSQASRLFSRHLAANETLSYSPLYVVEAIGYSGLIVIALTLMLRTDDIAHVLPALGLYGFAAYRMLPSAQIMYRGIAKLKFAAASLDTIHRDLMLAEEPTLEPGPALAPLREIRLQGIRYAYPSAPDKWVLDGLDLVVPANTTVGLVGRSGAGKSTLMDILLGLLHPRAGQFSVDGTPITPGNVAAWQRTVGYVPQHIYLSDSSIAENIAFGLAPDEIDMQAVERAARTAQVHDFIVGELPHGYATRVGDRGIRLSGGQRQRLGIARALYRDPSVLLMDEATSALDAQTEDALNDAIRKLAGSRTVIVIAHKRSSLRDCHRIVALENGSIRDAASGRTPSASQPSAGEQP